MVVSTIKKIKDFVDPALDAVKKNMDLEGMQEFATTVKRGKDKTYRPEKTIVRPSEEVEESLSLEDREKELIKKALEKHKGKRKYASEELGISERTLYRKIKEYNLSE